MLLWNAIRAFVNANSDFHNANVEWIADSSETAKAISETVRSLMVWPPSSAVAAVMRQPQFADHRVGQAQVVTGNFVRRCHPARVREAALTHPPVVPVAAARVSHRLITYSNQATCLGLRSGPGCLGGPSANSEHPQRMTPQTPPAPLSSAPTQCALSSWPQWAHASKSTPNGFWLWLGLLIALPRVEQVQGETVAEVVSHWLAIHKAQVIPADPMTKAISSLLLMPGPLT